MFLYKCIKIEEDMNWNDISQYQKLSENFILEFKDKVDWFCVPIYQNLSKEFKEELKKYNKYYVFNDKYKDYIVLENHDK